MPLNKYIRAQDDLKWYHEEGSLLFGLRGIDYDKVRVQVSCIGDATNDRRHRIYKRYLYIHTRLMAISPWARMVIEKRFEPVAWKASDKAWRDFGEWANVVLGVDIKGDNPGEKIMRAKQLVREAVKAYVDVKV